MDPQLISISGSNNNNNNTSTSTSNDNNYENNCVEENNGLQWTNEKHSNFLRLMEASFVRNLMERSSNNITKVTHHVTSRLDRFVPDISESTLDLHKSSDRVSRTCNRQKGRGIIRPYKMSHDQVVPHLKDKVGDKGQ
ncbi:uncharacterized protein LOC104906476 isoform X1 [Beta vulgaris subsp. vulgaris]|uniref:uncharacterized protein LOC104906476 isoform X1 n=1 Tax=Beta vulgaris subsp. vulgaris TaxID=3555 RepID=UPI0025470498|nr:uncharacterized protein LOC104906476 isoform X1 [Beta vulgaris subsp. vulgaris]